MLSDDESIRVLSGTLPPLPTLPDNKPAILLEEFDDAAQTIDLASRFSLTAREAEVLLWLSRGKTNRDIGEIIGMAQRTVNKHLEHIFAKLNVETRAAAAAIAVHASSR